MEDKGFYFRQECRACLSSNIKKAIKLASTPPGNNFLSKLEEENNEVFYPLEIYFCKNCNHIQLGHVVDPKILYQNDYSYVSSTSSVFVSHLENYANYVSRFLQLESDSFVVDIGSNDGTCLNFFKEKGMKVLGVDPATSIAEEAIKNGIPTVIDFFSEEVGEDILKKYGCADLITSHNACAHIDNLDKVILGIKRLLKETGVFVMEVGYFVDVFENIWFDTIYHEHLDYHTVAPLRILFERFDMEIFKVERISPQGGSIRVFVQHKRANHKIDESVREMVILEKDLGLDKAETLFQFESRINDIRDELKILINEIKAKGKKIAGYGAPTKATTLCHHFEIEGEDIDFIVDDNPLKQGLFSPGKHIRVCSYDEISLKKPDFLLILAWNFANSIMKKNMWFKESGGSFILPMPKPRIL